MSGGGAVDGTRCRCVRWRTPLFGFASNRSPVASSAVGIRQGGIDALARARTVGEAVVARELTKKFEEFARGRLSELEARYRKEPPRGECVVLVAGFLNRLRAASVSSMMRRARV